MPERKWAIERHIDSIFKVLSVQEGDLMLLHEEEFNLM